MAQPPQAAVFLDTSIQIARRVHGPKTKTGIRRRLAEHERTVTSLVVRQEYKRRLLKEASYLLTLLHRYGSFDEVNQHLIRLNGPWPGTTRKRVICLQMLTQVHEGTDAERTTRLRLYLRSLLVAGLNQFDRGVSEIRGSSSCACARFEVVEKEALRRYDLGPEHCSRTRPGACGVVSFLQHQKAHCQAILAKLRALPEAKKSAELTKSQQFLERLAADSEGAKKDDPCLSVGDLVIALESAGIPFFYTLNSTESQHLCRALDQTLIVRPINPTKLEVVCRKDDTEWPQFGP